MIDVWNELDVDKLEVGMNVGVYLWDKLYGNGPLIESGEIISIEEGFVRVKHNNNSVSAYQIGYYKFLGKAYCIRYENR